MAAPGSLFDPLFPVRRYANRVDTRGLIRQKQYRLALRWFEVCQPATERVKDIQPIADKQVGNRTTRTDSADDAWCKIHDLHGGSETKAYRKDPCRVHSWSPFRSRPWRLPAGRRLHRKSHHRAPPDSADPHIFSFYLFNATSRRSGLAESATGVARFVIGGVPDDHPTGAAAHETKRRSLRRPTRRAVPAPPPAGRTADLFQSRRRECGFG